MPESLWKLLGRRRTFDGFFKMDEVTISLRTPDETWSAPFTREIFLRGDAVGLLPYDPRSDRVVLTEQFRAPIALTTGEPMSVEIPAGIIDPEESMETCARRETLEETGCTVGRLNLIADYFTSPGGSTEKVTIFCGEVDADSALEQAGEASEHEYIRVFTRPFEAVMADLDAHRFTNGMTVIAMTWLRVNRDRLRREWGVAG